MVKAGVYFLIASAVVGSISTILVIVSLATPNWTSAYCHDKSGEEKCNVNYGLFTGILKRQTLGEQRQPYALTIACIMSANVCAWSCLPDADQRLNEVRKLFYEGQADFTCLPSRTRAIDENPKANNERDSSKFNNAGLWVSTLFFISLSALFHLVGVGFNILNIFSNPIETWAGVFGLYIWYGIAECSTALVLIIYGAHFDNFISNNVAILDTILEQYSTKGLASISWSYWILLVALCGDVFAIGLIYARQRQLNKVVEANVIKMEEVQGDGNVFMY